MNKIEFLMSGNDMTNNAQFNEEPSEHFTSSQLSGFEQHHEQISDKSNEQQFVYREGRKSSIRRLGE